MKPKIVKKIVQLLHTSYGSPRLGNKDDPIDEIVYIILSTKTSEKSFYKTYNKLKNKYDPWDKILLADTNEATRLIKFGGMASLKAKLIIKCLTEIRDRYGKIDLNFLKKEKDINKVESTLTSLYGIGIKTAKCVMLYSLNKQVLPVDTHTYRVAYRLGWIKKTEIRNEKGKIHKILEGIVPPTLRYKFHVNAVAHGRNTCLSRKPLCQCCPLTKYCCYYKNSIKLDNQ